MAAIRACASSKVEGQLVQVNIRRDVTNFATVDGDLIGEHARSWDLDGVGPVVVVVAKGIGKVENGFL